MAEASRASLVRVRGVPQNKEPRAYLFHAAKPGGGREWGILRATTPRNLADQLRGRRLVPLRSWALPSMGRSGPGRVSLKDQAELHGNLAQLLTRGVPLVEALDVCTSAVSRDMKPRVTRMRDMVASGSSFADACQAEGGLDHVSIAVYRAAERTGDLGGAAKQLSGTVRRQLAIRGKAATLMLYPIVVLSISIMVAIGMMTLVVPSIIENLKDAVDSMPWFTEVVYSVGVTLRDNAMPLLIGFGVLATLLFLFRARVIAFVAAQMSRLPFLRDVVLAQECARFFTVMSAMTRTGVVLSDALGVGEAALKHPTLKRELSRLRLRLIEGGVLRVLIDEVVTFPLPTRRLLIAAERSGDLQNAFDTLANDMADEVETRSSRLLALLEPAMIVLMFLLIGSLVLSIMIPLISVTSRVEGVSG